MKKSLFVILVVALFLGFSNTNANANDITHQFSSTEEDEILNSFDELGIEKETQKDLINKIRNGEILDSMKEDNINKALEEINTLSSNTTNNNFEQKIEYPDGSISIIGTKEIPSQNDEITTYANVNGTVKGYWYSGILNYSFLTDYTRTSGYDYITRVHSPAISIIGGSYSNSKVSIGRTKETSTMKAYSSLSFSYKIPTGSATVNLYTHIYNNTYHTSHSLNQYK